MQNGVIGWSVAQPEAVPAVEVYNRPLKNMSASVSPAGAVNRYPKTLNVNRYATKKTIAQGMLDVALLTANASQLKYVLQLGNEGHDYYGLMLGLIVTSLILQVVVGIMFLVIGGLDLNEKINEKTADILNNVIVVMIFVISVINIIINSFGMEQSSRVPPGTEFERLKNN